MSCVYTFKLMEQSLIDGRVITFYLMLQTLVTLEQSSDFRNVIVDAIGHETYVSQVQTNNVHVRMSAYCEKHI